MRSRKPGNKEAKARYAEWWRDSFIAPVLLLCTLSSPAAAQVDDDDECIRNQYQIQVVDRDVVAFGSFSSRGFGLEKDETVEAQHASGCVAAVATNRRFLFTSSRLGGSWISTELELNESPLAPLMGNTIAAFVTNRRFFGFDGLTGRFATAEIRSSESLVRTDVGANIAVAVTDQRLLAFALGNSTIQEYPLHLREDIESVEATSDVVTVRTTKRILYVGTGGGGWSERLRQLR